MTCRVLVFTLLGSWEDGVSYCLQHLVIAPPIPPLSQGFRAAAQDMLQETSRQAQWTCWSLCQSPAIQVGRAWENIVQWLDQELESSWLWIQKLSPSDLPGWCIFPIGPSSLLAHSHCPATAPLLHLCPNLPLTIAQFSAIVLCDVINMAAVNKRSCD